MKVLTLVLVVNIAMWLGVSAAIIAGLLVTGRLSVMWFFLIPLCGTMGTMDTKNVPDNQKKDGKNGQDKN